MSYPQLFIFLFFRELFNGYFSWTVCLEPELTWRCGKIRSTNGLPETPPPVPPPPSPSPYQQRNTRFDSATDDICVTVETINSPLHKISIFCVCNGLVIWMVSTFWSVAVNSDHLLQPTRWLRCRWIHTHLVASWSAPSLQWTELVPRNPPPVSGRKSPLSLFRTAQLLYVAPLRSQGPDV